MRTVHVLTHTKTRNDKNQKLQTIKINNRVTHTVSDCLFLVGTTTMATTTKIFLLDSTVRTVLLLVLVLVGSMIVPKTHSLNVAVLGSGIAGSSAARSLAEKGFAVTVFEAGFGIGGRTSTRITKDENDSSCRYQFDHGAQYIGRPKTEAFRTALEAWKQDGFVREWSGTFGTAVGSNVEAEAAPKDRWVGFPRMNSISGNLLHHNNIRVRLQTRADAARTDERWTLTHGKTKQDLGSFDWLVASDRNSGAHYRTDLAGASVGEFTTRIRGVQSVKSLTAMVVFERPIGLELDGIQFTGKDADRYGSLGWVAKDTSKPGRERRDGRECWVLQSHPDAATQLLKGKRKIGEIRDMAREVLVGDFLDSLPHLTTTEHQEVPPIVTSVGHRWGAAFPVPPPDFADKECQLVASEHFVACGDYFGSLPGRIEGAYLSGVAAANEIAQVNQELIR